MGVRTLNISKVDIKFKKLLQSDPTIYSMMQEVYISKRKNGVL